MFDPMSELGSSSSGSSYSGGDFSDQPRRPRPAGRGGFSGGRPGGQSDGGSFATEIHSVSIHAKERTFYLDLK